jgi:REP-associated tyrosine transposase
MPTNLHRYYGAGYLHFITTSCYQRRALLDTTQNRDLLLEVMERVRQRYRFVVVGYVVMPEHVHLLLSEPERGDPSVVMKVLKQSFARQLLNRCRAGLDPQQSCLWKIPLTAGHVWQHRFYDFVVFTEKKRVEKLRYMHRNPVVRGLVLAPEHWNWSSYRHYALGERGPVLVNEARKAEMRVRGIA